MGQAAKGAHEGRHRKPQVSGNRASPAPGLAPFRFDGWGCQEGRLHLGSHGDHLSSNLNDFYFGLTNERMALWPFPIRTGASAS